MLFHGYRGTLSNPPVGLGEGNCFRTNRINLGRSATPSASSAISASVKPDVSMPNSCPILVINSVALGDPEGRDDPDPKNSMVWLGSISRASLSNSIVILILRR